MAELYQFGAFRLDRQERRLTCRGDPVHLEPKSFDLLCHLLERAGSLVSKQELIEAVWARTFVSDNALTRIVHQIRTALGDDASAPAYIETVPGAGYRFIASVTRADERNGRPESEPVPRRRFSHAAAWVITVAVFASALAWIGSGAWTPAQAPVRRVAILPLPNLTGDDARRYLVQGIHEALIADLGRATGLDVISRTSVMRYRQSDATIAEIAETLDVDAVVEGSIMIEGAQLYLTVQLVAARPERALWSERFELDSARVFETSAEIAHAIASEVGADSTSTKSSVLGSHREISPAAYDAFLRARFHFEGKTPDDYRLAQQFYRRAIDLDPEFAAAYAGLAHTYGSAAVWGIRDPAEAMPEARRLAERAISIDSSLADAELILAGVSFYWDWDVTEAQAALLRVLDRNPNSAPAYRMLAEVLSVTGRHEDAFAALARARELDPLSPTAQFKPAFNRYLSRDYERAIDIVRAGQAYFPDFWQADWVLCLALSETGRHEQAIVACRAAVEKSGRASVAMGALGYALARAGKTAEARSVADALEALRETRYVGAANLAIIDGALGGTDQAFEELARAYENRDWLLVHANNASFFDTLRTDARFRALEAIPGSAR